MRQGGKTGKEDRKNGRNGGANNWKGYFGLCDVLVGANSNFERTNSNSLQMSNIVEAQWLVDLVVFFFFFYKYKTRKKPKQSNFHL